MTPVAQCAVHPQVTATRICVRCGKFMCRECSLGDSELQCPPCRALLGSAGFPYTRADHDFGRLWDHAWAAFKREWVMLSVGVLILIGGSVAVAVVVQIFQAIAGAIAGKSTAAVVGVVIASQLVSWVLNALVIGVLWMGLNRVLIDVIKGGKADLARLLSQLPKLGTFFAQWLISLVLFDVPIFAYFGGVIAVAIRRSGHSLPPIGADPKTSLSQWVELMPDLISALLIAGLIAAVPLLWLGLARAMVVPEIVYGNARPWESIVRAFRLASGFRLSLFGYSLVGGLLMFVGIIACCVGLLPAIVLWQLLTVSLYLALRSGSGLPPPEE